MMGRFTSVGLGKKARNIKQVSQLFQHRKTLWQMLREVVKGRYKMSFLTTMAVILAVLYVLFPFDFITDLLPVIGWADDGIVVYLLVKRLQKETQRFNRFKVMERRNASS